MQESDKVANQSIRVNVDTLEHLMTMVSELVLTRNQLLEISRRNEDTEFKVPLQRLSNVTAELQEGVMKTRMQPIGNAWQKLPRIVHDIDGFRLDVAEMVPLGFWREYRRFVRSINPEAYLVGEVWWEKWPDRMYDPAPGSRATSSMR